MKDRAEGTARYADVEGIQEKKAARITSYVYFLGENQMREIREITVRRLLSEEVTVEYIE